MQNLKPIEDYKKDLRSSRENEMPKEPILGDEDIMDMGDLGDEEPQETPDLPTYSAEIPGKIEVEENSAKPYMVITNLKKICDQTSQLIKMIQANGKVEQWAVDHITTSADDIEEVFNYFKYKD